MRTVYEQNGMTCTRQGDAYVFEGGNFNEHRLAQDQTNNERLLAHWKGYLEANGFRFDRVHEGDRTRQHLIDILIKISFTDEDRKLEYAQREWELKQRFLKYHDGNGVHIWNGGRDCDGVVYGHVDFVACDNYDEYVEAYEHAGSWADGPFSWSILADSEIEQAKTETFSRDTFAESAGY